MVYKHAIFMRLGIHPGSGLSALHTLREYEVFVAQHGEAWFPVAAAAGMSERMRCEFQDAIDYHYVLELYLAVGREGGGTDIARKAEVGGIEISRAAILTPAPALTPEPWRSDVRCTWLKIRNLMATDVAADGLVVLSTGRRLSQALAQPGGYHFGYVKRVEDAEL
jgi:hypothetical protein